MANRHLARTIVLQTLFEWDFLNGKSSIDAIYDRNAKEFAPELGSSDFSTNLLKSVVEKKNDLDSLITKAAPDWPLDKISGVDRNILRMGLSELLFGDHADVPPKVAINESIELAKDFGGSTSGKFVNGVMGAVYRELGEPGKDDQPKKNSKMNIPDEEAPVFSLGGAVVYYKFEDGIKVALVHDVFGHWTLSKGKAEEGEEIKTATKREVKEEIGLDIEIKDDLGTNEYIAYNPELGKIKKRVHYFLAEATTTDIKLEENSGGLTEAKWFPLEEIAELNFYSDILPIVTKAVEKIIDKKAE